MAYQSRTQRQTQTQTQSFCLQESDLGSLVSYWGTEMGRRQRRHATWTQSVLHLQLHPTS